MTFDFEELDYQVTPLGDISLRRRAEPRLGGTIVYEVKLGDEFLMSSLFTEAEIQLARLGLAALDDTGENTFDVTGDLTILGTTKPVTLTTTINKAGNHPLRNVPTVGVSASTKLMRSEWGLGAYVPAVSDEVELSIEVELLAE